MECTQFLIPHIIPHLLYEGDSLDFMFLQPISKPFPIISHGTCVQISPSVSTISPVVSTVSHQCSPVFYLRFCTLYWQKLLKKILISFHIFLFDEKVLSMSGSFLSSDLCHFS